MEKVGVIGVSSFCRRIVSPVILAVVAGASFTGCVLRSMPEHFNLLAEREEQNSKDVIPFLDLGRGDTVADLGAGGGYFSVRLARAVGSEGKVYAADINVEYLEFIREYAKAEGVTNLHTVEASINDSGLGDESVDFVFMRNSYHDFRNRVAYFARFRRVFKQGGRIAIIDYDPAKLGFFRRLIGHHIAERTLRDEMRRAGYALLESHDFLPSQSFNIFGPTSDIAGDRDF